MTIEPGQTVSLDEFMADDTPPQVGGKTMTLDEFMSDTGGEDKVPFLKRLGNNLYSGVLAGATGFNRLIGLGAFEPTRKTFIEPGEKYIEEVRNKPAEGHAERFADEFMFNLGSMGITLPMDIMTGGATKAVLAGKVLPEVSSLITKIPNFAIGMGERAFLKNVEEGKPIEAVIQGAEDTSMGMLYGAVGKGWQSFPKMASLGLAEAHYEATKQNRIATPEEQIKGVANGLAFATVFHAISALEKGIDTIQDKFYLSKVKESFELALREGNIDTIRREYEALINNPEVSPKVKEVLTNSFEKANAASLEDLRARNLPQEPQQPIAQELQGKTQETVEGSPYKESMPQEVDPVKKVIAALKEAESLRGKQETLYSQERAKRLAKVQSVGKQVSGEKGFYSQLGALKGELPKVEFESIRSKLKQNDIDSLFNMVEQSPKLGEWDKISTKEGLAKLFGEYGGKVPTEREITMLNRVFGKEFAEVLIAKRSLFEKIKYVGGQIGNIPRSIMASFDLSAPFRQGAFLIGRPKQFWPAFSKMFKAFGSEKYYQTIQEEILRNPNFELARESKLSLTDMDSLLNEREERFMSNWAENIPGVGKGIRASGRAYTGFLNKLRMDVFTDLVNKADSLGLNPKSNMDLTMNIANFVNNATGRGSLGGVERAAIALNSIMFSPRLMMSRLNLLNPSYYVNLDPFTRKEALKSLSTFLGTGFTVLTLAKMGGANVGLDPRSADFGKIKIGDTRIDIWGGFQQIVRAFGQIWTGQIVSSTSGRIMTLGEGYKPMTRWDIVLRFFESKESPVFSFFVNALKGSNMIGDKFDLKNEIVQRFIPMVLQDMYETLKENPKAFPATLLGMFGVGVQTYKNKVIKL